MKTIQIVYNLLDIFGPLLLISVLLIAAYLVKHGLYSWSGIGFCFFWPKLIVDYKAHTQKNAGRVGIWYYLFIVSLVITVFSVLISLGVHISN